MSSWIDHKDDFDTSGGRLKTQRSEVGEGLASSREKPVLTVAEVADMLGVDKQTIRRKYLALDPEDDAPIPFDAWYRLPGGHIRIYRFVIEKIKIQGK